MPERSPSRPDLALLTRPKCHLCDEMRVVLDEVLPGLDLDYREVDIDNDPQLVERYGESIPVLLRDGRAVAKVRIEPSQLRRIVARRRWW